MKKIEAKTLEDAYTLATKEFGCSITELDCEIIQYHTPGILGLFAKNAIIVVAKKREADNKKQSETNVEKIKLKKRKESNASEQNPKNIKDENIEESIDVGDHEITQKVVLDSFFDDDKEEIAVQKNNIPLQEEIEKELKELIELSCFDIDVVEVDVIDNTAYVFIDGEDAALLIGKEGYRYNALSYLISNWLQNRYQLYIKLEIAQFLASQQEMIRSYMQPVIEHVEQEGWGRTRSLDGVLVQIALEQLREEFPNKYVAIKRTRNGDRYILINEFNKK